jgi:hypothetical protein
MLPMQKIPLESREELRFTPPALKDEEKPPVFVLRVVSRRERGRFDDSLIEAGLSRVSDEEIRNEMIAAATVFYGDAHEEQVNRMRDYWAALEDYIDGAKGLTAEQIAEREPFEHPDTQAMADLEARIYDHWQPLGRMYAQNKRFERENPLCMIAAAVQSWEGVDVPMVRDAGWLTPDCVAEMGGWLGEKYGTVIGATAWMQLYTAAIGRFFLLPSAEKNSESPPLSTPSPTDTADTHVPQTDGTSQESDTSTATPDT